MTWVNGRVRLLPAPLLLLDNQRKGAAVGVNVYQIGVATDGMALLVDLGWLPVAGNRTLPRPEALSGTCLLSGLLSPPPSMGFAHGACDVRTGRWQLAADAHGSGCLGGTPGPARWPHVSAS